MKPFAIAGLISAWLLLTAGSCATTGEEPVKIVTVDLPTPISCVPPNYQAPPASPVTRAALLAARDAAARYQMLSAFWTIETPVLAVQSGVIAACQAAGQPHP